MRSCFLRSARVLSLFVVVQAFGLLLLAQPAHAQAPQAWTGVCVGAAGTSAEDVATIQGIQCLLANVLSIAVSGIGVAGFVMMIIGAFKMLVGGTSKGLDEGKNTMTLAIVGLIVALSAWIIINFIATFTGVHAIKGFRIPDSTNQF